MPRRRPLERAAQVDAEHADAEDLDREAGRDLDDQVERREPQQRVEAEVPLDAERIEAEEELRPGSRSAPCWMVTAK